MNNPVTLILARGGSKSIPLKNIKIFNRYPLIFWNITSAFLSNLFDNDNNHPNIFVSTDHEQIAKESIKSGAQVFYRSIQTATDTASSESAMIEFAKAHPEFDIIILLQCTSPLTSHEDIKKAYDKFIRLGADSLVSVTREHRFIWKEKEEDQTGFVDPQNYDPINRPRRQDWNGELIENGAIYICKRIGLLKYKSRLFGNITYYEMHPNTRFEIDEPNDWDIMEQLHKKMYLKNISN